MLEVSEILVGLTSAFLIVFVKLLDKNPQPILGCYQRKSGLYWFKVAFMHAMLKIRKLKRTVQKEAEGHLEELEKGQKLSMGDKAVDGVCMNGADIHGNHLIVGITRRNKLLVDNFLILKINNMLLQSPRLPDTTLYNDDECSTDGIKISLIEPMKKWQVSYAGNMKKSDGGDCEVTINGIWTSDVPHFNFNTDKDALCLAKSLAYEKWNRNYFDLLKSAAHTHYEQFGTLKATVTIDDKEYKLQLDTLRTHSFGVQRQWRQIHRSGFHFFTAENGDHFSVGKICCPMTFSRWTIGHVYCSATKAVYPIEECDMELFQQGEFGTPPRDYAFCFKARGHTYTVDVQVQHSQIFYVGKDWDTKCYENLCKFKVNGFAAWGATEWQYRNIKGRSEPRYS